MFEEGLKNKVCALFLGSLELFGGALERCTRESQKGSTRAEFECQRRISSATSEMWYNAHIQGAKVQKSTPELSGGATERCTKE